MKHAQTKTSLALAIAVLAALSASPMHAQVDAFFDNFSNGAAKGWTLGTEWQIGGAVGSGIWQCGSVGDPGVDADGTPGGGVAGVVIGGAAGIAVHGDYSLVSPVIYLEPGVPATLSFARWLQSDYAPFMTNTIEVYDGTTWVVIFQTGAGQCTTDLSWQNLSYDVSAQANPAFRVRFSFRIGSSGAFNAPSWNLDNVRVTIPSSAKVRFADDFSNGNSRGWTLGTDWQIGGATVSPAWICSSSGDPGVDADGTPGGGIAGVIIGGSIDPNLLHGDYSITSPIIHLTPGAKTTLSFSRWLGTDYSPFMTSTVSVFDGTSWHVVFFNSPSCTGDTAWSQFTYDVTAHANPYFRFRFSYAVPTLGAYAAPSWNIDNVVLRQGVGQANSPAASLTVNGAGPLGEAGPFAESVTNASGLNLLWHGTPNMPVILAGSLNEGPHTDLAGLGRIDIGTAPTFSDVFVIFDGLSFPGSLYATLDPSGTNVMNLSAAGIPIGAEFYVQGLVAQFGTGNPAPFTFTAAHKLTKL